MIRGATRYATILSCALGVACSSGERAAPSGSTSSATRRSDSVRAAVAAESVANARDEWNKDEVIKRLTEAGLVVKDEKRTESHPPITIEGDVLTVSNSAMQIFVFPDRAMRQRASAALDTTSLKPGMPAPRPDRPRYVMTNNLIAIYSTPDDRLAERIENALMARHTGM